MNVLVAVTTMSGFQLPSGTEIAPAAATAEADEDSMPKEDPSKLQRAEGEEQEQVCVTCLTIVLVRAIW